MIENMKKHSFLLFFSAILLTIFSTVIGAKYFYHDYCHSLIPANSEFGKSPVLDFAKVNNGHTLFTNLSFNDYQFDDQIYLVDLYGKAVHIWKTKNKTLYSILKPNGNLLASQTNIIDTNFPQAARITSIQELDPQSNVVWEYQNGGMHHDFDLLPNGNIAVLTWEKIPHGLAQQITGGKQGTEFNKTDTFSDKILEIDQNKNIVWSWSAYTHLNINEDKIPSFFSREQWTHANSIKFIKYDPIYKKEAYLVSMRYLNEIFLISKETGEVIWKSPKGLLGHQHDATFLDNGNILVFNNAFYSEAYSLNPYNYGSQVLEIDPRTNKVVWEFSGGNNPLDRARLTEVILSGAQRLPNGNTLITLGTSGRLLEVTPDKKIVWDFINPYSDPSNEPFPSNYIFKARRYFQTEIPWLNSLSGHLPIIVSICES
jgi:DNA-binding beta-propeller fold protein YncE